MNHTDARHWHPWLRINRVLRVMLHSAGARRSGRRGLPQVKVSERLE